MKQLFNIGDDIVAHIQGKVVGIRIEQDTGELYYMMETPYGERVEIRAISQTDEKG